MTVSTELSHEEYTGNGVTTDFDFRFRIFEAKHLVVSVADPDGTERILTNGTDYTLRGVGSYRGGKVILKMPLATGWKIGIARDLPAVQETDLRNQGKFFAEVHEDAFDYLTMLIQKSLGFLSLCLRKPSFISDHYDAKGNKISNLGKPVKDGDAVNLGTMKDHISAKDKRSLRVADKDIPVLPNTANRANKILAFDNDGNPKLVLPESGSAADVLLELAKPTGAGLVGTESGKTVQEAISSPNNSYLKEIYKKLNFKFDGYDNALEKIKNETNGMGTINPDGLSIDDDGNIFISCPTSVGPMESSRALIVVYGGSGDTKTYFWLPKNTATLSLRIIGGERSGWKIYGRNRVKKDSVYNIDTLLYWELPRLPDPDSTLDIKDATTTNFPVGQLMSVSDKYVMSLITRPSLAAATFCRITMFDIVSGKITGTVFIPKTLIAYDTLTTWIEESISVSDIYRNTWKIQDFTYSETTNTFLFSVGANFEINHPNNGNVKHICHDLGVFEVDVNGNIVKHSIVKPMSFIDKISKAINVPFGNNGRIEMEGVHCTKEGRVFTCVVYTPENNAETASYLIMEEFAKESESHLNFSNSASLHTAFRNINYDGLAGPNGMVLNPITKVPFVSLNEVFNCMMLLDIAVMSFHVKNEPVIFASEVELSYFLDDTAKITIESVRAGTRFILTIKSATTASTGFYVYGKKDGWTLEKIPNIAHSIKLNQVGTITGVNPKYGVVSAMSVNVSDVNRTVNIGDDTQYAGAGNDKLVSPNRVFISASKSYNDHSSRTVLAVSYTDVRAGTDSAISLGAPQYKWKDIYASNGAIITSDERKKSKISDLCDAEKNTAITIKSLIKKYKMKDAVVEKGDSARWHFGIIAQDVVRAFEANGLNAFDYGVVCYDEWGDTPAEYNDSGNKVAPEVVAGSSYAIRYDELLCFIISAM